MDNELVYESRAMRKVVEWATTLAESDVAVLIEGETGVGKEKVARLIHSLSHRAGAIFLPVNCGAVPETLFEAEFFGHERGAFTGAVKTRRGYLELADKGILFLDEISEMPTASQVKLLRALEDMWVTRLGGGPRISLDVRIIASSNQDLPSMMERGRFRTDLFYRIAVTKISIPPLRDRTDDIDPLARHFLRLMGADGSSLCQKALKKLRGYHWPGNVRELQSCIARAVLRSRENLMIEESEIEFDSNHSDSIIECENLKTVLDDCNGCVSKAARRLQVHRNTVYNRMKKYRMDFGTMRTRGGHKS